MYAFRVDKMTYAGCAYRVASAVRAADSTTKVEIDL